MVIDARRIFRCAHTYVSVKDAGLLVFVCASCGYRTELLPLPVAKPPANGDTRKTHIDTDGPAGSAVRFVRISHRA